MAWSFKKAVERVTKWNAAEVNNLQEGVEEAKATAVTAQAKAEEALTNGVSKSEVEAIAATLPGQSTAAGEQALQTFRGLSTLEQGVHTSNTAIGWHALKALNGLNGVFPPTGETAIGSSVINLTGVESKAGGAYSGGASNTPIIVFRALTAGVTGLSTGTAYYVVNGTANAFECSLTKGGAGVKVTGHALEAASTEVALLASAEDNTCIGSQAGASLTTGGGNTLLGENAGHNLSTGEENVALGCEALGHEKTVIGNTAIGFLAAWASEGSTPTIAIGNQALEKNVAGNWNLAVGNQAMREGSGQSFNLAVGHSNMKKATAGAEGNTAIGILCMKSLTTGKFNTSLGETSGDKLSTGSKNTLLGTEAGATLTTTSGNVFIGNQAGKSLTGENELRIANNETTPWIGGAESGKKLAFMGATPVARPKVGKASGGVLAEDTTLVNALREALVNLGLVQE